MHLRGWSRILRASARHLNHTVQSKATNHHHLPLRAMFQQHRLLTTMAGGHNSQSAELSEFCSLLCFHFSTDLLWYAFFLHLFSGSLCIPDTWQSLFILIVLMCNFLPLLLNLLTPSARTRTLLVHNRHSPRSLLYSNTLTSPICLYGYLFCSLCKQWISGFTRLRIRGPLGENLRYIFASMKYEVP